MWTPVIHRKTHLGSEDGSQHPPHEALEQNVRAPRHRFKTTVLDCHHRSLFPTVSHSMQTLPYHPGTPLPVTLLTLDNLNRSLFQFPSCWGELTHHKFVSYESTANPHDQTFAEWSLLLRSPVVRLSWIPRHHHTRWPAKAESNFPLYLQISVASPFLLSSCS